MAKTYSLVRFLSFGVLLATAGAATFGAAITFGEERVLDPSGVEFFERKIRPVLVEHCYSCHSNNAETIQGGLKLDTRANLRQGGDSGAAVVPGSPEESLLLSALRYESLEMPPKGKLPESVAADFAMWIAQGAPDPRDNEPQPGAPKPTSGVAGGASASWAFQPLRRPALPVVKDHQWPTSPVDYFLLAQLEAVGLSPAPEADRRTLLRRVYYDLIGLPPTWEEVQAFEHDLAPDAFERVVDQLLASPQYGERWGRHWLDVARYADTKDLVLVYGQDAIRPYAYTYRDYVIRAWNEDTPYDRFIHEQLAAEQMDPPVEPWRLGAMGFLTLGRLFDNNPPDIYDDQIDTVTRGFLGLTVACARCHDHKYDPVPTDDYYSLYGVFANSQRPVEAPRIDETLSVAASEFEAKAAPKRAVVRQIVNEQYQQITATARQRTADYLLKMATQRPDPLENAVFFLSLSPEDLKPQFLASWRRYLSRRATDDDPVFGLWRALLALPEDRFRDEAPQVVEHWLKKVPGIAPGQCNPRLRQALLHAKLTTRADVAAFYGQVLTQALETSSEDAPNAANDTARAQLADVLTDPDGPLAFPKSHTYLYMARVDRSNYESQLQELDKLAVQDAKAPPRAMTLEDSEQIREPHVFVRGNPRQLGAPVPRRFLQVLSSGERKPFTHGSGRLELAQAITSPNNPLTARVMVNRVWMHHFGEPLVATPSDFGARSDPPTHPELLDYLAWTFQYEGWSLKKLHRLMVLSRAFRQTSRSEPSTDLPDAAVISKDGSSPAAPPDPQNRLLSRFPRRRLEFEAMRDTFLFLSGRLDLTLYGRPVDVAGDAHKRRRTIYGLVDRQNLPGLYRAFDFASPDQSADRRPNTTTPQQALFGMNSLFLIEQAKALASRPETYVAPNDAGRVCGLYRLVLAREPSETEISAGLRFIQAAEDDATNSLLTPWEQYAQVLLLTNEVIFVD
jgi:hypothetical protein